MRTTKHEREKLYLEKRRCFGDGLFLTLCIAQKSLAAGVPDYADSNNCLSLPAKADKTIDVFYVYPSTWDGSDPKDGIYADINNEQMRKAAQAQLNNTIGMFNQIANIYAPFYRQADKKDVLGKTMAEVEAVIGAEPGEDGLTAFKY